MSPLGDWSNVPGRPGYYYGLAIREEDGITVEVYRHRDGTRIGTVEARGWTDVALPGAGPGVHTKARQLIDSKEENA